MKLLTKSIEKKLRANSAAQDGTKSFNAVLKLFNPTGIGTWYLSELDEFDNFYGVCDLGYAELGYVSLDELQSFKGVMGLGIERDAWFDSNKYPLNEFLNK
jgi:hypothetical protein|tara:strand:- start:55 stop:357 length:303 start_codon:yes stop_codon:yes gene_type:complete